MNRTGQVLGAKIEVKSLGPTPAKKAVLRRAIRLLPYPLTHPLPEDADTGGAFKQDFVIWPDRGGIPAWAEADRVFSEEEVAQALTVNESGVRIYLFGCLTYEDVFGGAHSSTFCYFLDPASYTTVGGETFVWAIYPGENNFT